MDEILENEHVARYHGNDSDTLVVWFGGINEPFFSEKFASHSQFDCLYFRDSACDWYVGGLHLCGYTKADFILLLKEFCASRYKFVCFCGQSSGGYAALYYGLVCHADLCIVFSPQTKNTFNGQCAMTPHVRLEDIAALYQNETVRPLVLLNIARSERDHIVEFEWRDHDQVADLRLLDGVTTIIHPYDNHAVSVKMREAKLLYTYVSGMVTVYRSSWG